MKLKAGFFIWMGLALSLIIAFFLSPLASSYPDGLEKVAETLGFIEVSEGAEAWTNSPAPDYSLPGVRSGGLSTGLAGAAGTIILFGLGFAAGRILKRGGTKSQG